MRVKRIRDRLRKHGLPGAISLCVFTLALIASPLQGIAHDSDDHSLLFSCGSSLVIFPDGVKLEDDLVFEKDHIRIAERGDSAYIAGCFEDLDAADSMELLRRFLNEPLGEDAKISADEVINFEAFGRPSMEATGVISLVEDDMQQVLGFRTTMSRPEVDRTLILVSFERDWPVSFDYRVFKAVDATASRKKIRFQTQPHAEQPPSVVPHRPIRDDPSGPFPLNRSAV